MCRLTATDNQRHAEVLLLPGAAVDAVAGAGLAAVPSPDPPLFFGSLEPPRAARLLLSTPPAPASAPIAVFAGSLTGTNPTGVVEAVAAGLSPAEPGLAAAAAAVPEAAAAAEARLGSL